MIDSLGHFGEFREDFDATFDGSSLERFGLGFGSFFFWLDREPEVVRLSSGSLSFSDTLAAAAATCFLVSLPEAVRLGCPGSSSSAETLTARFFEILPDFVGVS